MINLKRTLLQGLLLAAFAIIPMGAGTLSAQSEPTNKVENSELAWRGGYYGRPYYHHYYRPYYRPYYYNYYYYPYYRPYYYYYW